MKSKLRIANDTQLLIKVKAYAEKYDVSVSKLVEQLLLFKIEPLKIQ